MLYTNLYSRNESFYNGILGYVSFKCTVGNGDIKRVSDIKFSIKTKIPLNII